MHVLRQTRALIWEVVQERNSRYRGMGGSFNRYLLDDLVEEGAGVLGLDLLLNPPVWGHEGDVDLIGGTRTASDDSKDTAIPGKHNRPGVATTRKLAVLVVIGQHSDLDGCLRGDAMLLVDPLEGLETVRATDSGPRGRPVLDNKYTLVTMDIKVLGVAQLRVRDDTDGLEETIFRVLVVGSVGGLREQ